MQHGYPIQMYETFHVTQWVYQDGWTGFVCISPLIIRDWISNHTNCLQAKKSKRTQLASSCWRIKF